MSDTIHLLARFIEALGGVVIARAMLASIGDLVAGRLRNEGIEAMRQRLAVGAVSALSLMTAATLLKTITLRSWSAIGMFAVVLALRTLVKLTLAPEARSAQPR